MNDLKDNCIAETREHKRIVGEYIQQVVIELTARIKEHDNSKMEDPELEIFAEYTPKLKNCTYGSDEYKGYLQEMGRALKHHYEHNRHHPEFHKNGICDMNLVDFIEMICDWLAATKRHANERSSACSIAQSIEFNQDRFGYANELKLILQNTVRDVLK